VGRKYGNGNLEEKNLEVEVFVAKNTEEKDRTTFNISNIEDN